MSDAGASDSVAGPSTEGPARVLVVDDESNITDLVSTALRYEGFDVATAHDGREALSTVETFRPDLVVLDVMLPDLDGFEVQRRLRDHGDATPVLFLTARTPPRTRCGVSRSGATTTSRSPSASRSWSPGSAPCCDGPGSVAPSERLRFADLELDEDAHEVWRGRAADRAHADRVQPAALPARRTPRRVLSKAQILDHVWQYDFGGDAAIVETYISYLRKKVDVVEPRLIHTVRGVGYVLRLPRE